MNSSPLGENRRKVIHILLLLSMLLCNSIQLLNGKEYVAKIDQTVKNRVISLLQEKNISVRFPFETISISSNDKGESVLSAKSKSALESLKNFLIIDSKSETDILKLNIPGLIIHGPSPISVMIEFRIRLSLMSKDMAQVSPASSARK